MDNSTYENNIHRKNIYESITKKSGQVVDRFMDEIKLKYTFNLMI